MAKIKLTDGFKNLQVGDAQTLLVKKVKFNEKFQKIAITFADDNGGTCVENFNLMGNNDKPNDVAYGIFSTIYKCCKGGEAGDEVDPTAIEGCYIVADVFEQVVKDEDGDETGRYIHVRNFREADGAAEDADDGDVDEDEDDEGEGSWY